MAGDRPRAIPSGTPMAVAIARLARTRARLGRMLPVASEVRNTCAAGPENHTWYIRATIADGGGKNELCACDAHSCQPPIPAIRTTQRHTHPIRFQFILSPRGGCGASAA